LGKQMIRVVTVLRPTDCTEARSFHEVVRSRVERETVEKEEHKKV
jgi:hypothetical protein